MSHARRAARAALAVGVLLVRAAGAQGAAASAPPSESTSESPTESALDAVRFQYAAPPDCPDEHAFLAQVRARTQRGRVAGEGELARTFKVELFVAAAGYEGVIEFLDDSGTKVSRRLRGEQCEAVVSSLALITALALDSALRETDVDGNPASTASTVSSPPKPLPSKAETPDAALPPAHRASSNHAPRARIGASATYDSLTAAPGLALLGQLDTSGGVAWRLTAHYARSEFAVDAGRRAVVRLLGLETSVCPVRWRERQLVVTPCAALALGSLRGEGVQGEKLTAASGKTIAWASLGTELRLAWEPALPLWLELRASASLPLVRHAFQFEAPNAQVLEVPWIFGAVGTAVGVRF